MTDKERAEEYFCEYCDNSFEHDNGQCSNCSKWDCFIAGLAEGRKEKWHDLRKDPNDLPKHSGLYCVQCGEVREYVKEEKSWFTVHFEPCMNRTEETYLWCEIPKFEG